MPKDKAMIYWISWYQPTEDYRPTKWPLPNNFLGYWCSGYRCSDEAATLCAAIIAGNEEEAKALIREHWPELKEWRFCEENPDFKYTERFSKPSWIKEDIDHA